MTPLAAPETPQVFFAAVTAAVECLILFMLLVLERAKAVAAIAQATFLAAAGTAFFASGKLALTAAEIGEKTLVGSALQFAGFQNAQFFQGIPELRQGRHRQSCPSISR